MATKKNANLSRKGRKGKKPRDDGSPIKVGGGGGKRKKGARQNEAFVWCDFDHRAEHYPDPDRNRKEKKTFKNINWAMKELWFKRRGLDENLTSSLPSDGKCTIDITREGSDNDLQIAGKPLGIAFDDGTYEFVYGSSKKHQNRNSKKVKVKIKGGSISIQEEFGPLDLWEVRVNYLIPTPKRSPKRRRSR